MSDLRRRVLSSAVWSTGGALAFRLANMLTGIVAARLLAPSDFGLFAVVLVVAFLLGALADLGVGTAVIRARPEEVDRVAPTATTLSLVSFTGLGALMALGAPWVARAFGAPDAAPALAVVALYVVLCGPAAVPAAFLVRNFQQRRRVVIDFAGLTLSSAVLVVLALRDWGEMALAWSRVGGQAFVVVALLLTAARRYHPGWDRSQAIAIVALGLPLVGANLIGNALAAVDVFVISRLLGPHEAGVFNLANLVAAWPLGLFLPVLVSVGLPLFSRIRDDPDLVGRLLASCMDLVSAVFWPVSAVLAALAPQLVEVLYGTKWAAAASILSVLALAKAFEVVMALLADVLIAGGHAQQYMGSQLLRLLVVLPAAWWAVPRWGSVAAAWVSVAVLALVVVPWNLTTAGRMTARPAWRAFRHTAWPAVCALVAGATSYVVAQQLEQAWAGLLVGAAAGAGVHLLLVGRWGLRAYRRTTLLQRTAQPVEQDA